MSQEENVLIPEEMDYDHPPMLPVSRSYQRLFPAQAGEVFRENQVLEFKIPPSDRCYLGKRSYLSMDIHAKFVPGAGDKYMDDAFGIKYSSAGDAFQNTAVLSLEKCGALGCIDKIQVFDYSGINLLEDTAGNGQLMCLLRDLNTGLFESQFHGSFIGSAPSNVSHMWNDGITTMENVYQSGTNLQESVTGDTFLQPLEQTPWVYEPAGQYTWPYLSEVYRIKSVVIPLFSFLGVLSDQMVPLHNGFTIRFTLNANQNAYCFTNPYGNTAPHTIATNATNAQINDIFYNHVNLVCDYYELSPLAEQLIRSTRSSDDMIVHTKAYRRNEFFMKPEQKEFSYTLNANLKSIRNLFWFTRPLYNKLVNSSMYTFPVLSNRVRNFVSKWWLTINHEILPATSQKISCGADDGDTLDYTPSTLIGLAGNRVVSSYPVVSNRSAQSMYHLLNTQNFNSSKYNSLISKQNYEIDDNAPVAYPLDKVDSVIWDQFTYANLYTLDNMSPYFMGKFAAGLNLQARPYASVNTMSGTDFTEKIVRLEGTRSNTVTSQTTGGNVVDVFVEYDAFVHIVPGQVTTVVF